MADLTIAAVEVPRSAPRILLSEHVTPSVQVDTFGWRAPARFTAPEISFSAPQPLFVTGDKFTILTERSGLVASSTYMFGHYRWTDLLSAPRTILPLGDGPVLVAGNAAWRNHSHWLFQCFTPILLAADVGLDGFHALVPPLNAVQRECLALVGLDPGRFTELPAGTAAVTESGIFSNLSSGDFPFFPHPAIITAFGRLAAVAPRSDYAGRNIFISRANARKRVMVNEAELRDRLQAMGYAIIDPAELGMAEQIALFRDARLIVGQHGAAMTNLLFCPDGEQGPFVVELQQENYPALAFAKIAQVKSLRYTAIINRMVEPGLDRRHDSTWEADIPLICKVLAEI